MSKEQLIHIFDNSACLNKRQLKDYVSGGMTNEEAHAVEVHLNSCPFCNEAVDGLFEQQEGHMAVAELNTDFLQDHFSHINPQIHLNSLAPAQGGHAVHLHHPKKKKTQSLWRTSWLAAALLLPLAIIWYTSTNKRNRDMSQIAAITSAADNNNPTSASPAMATEPVAEQKVIASNEPVKDKQFSANETGNGNNSGLGQPILYAADTKEKEEPALPAKTPVADTHREKQPEASQATQPTIAASDATFAPATASYEAVPSNTVRKAMTVPADKPKAEAAVKKETASAEKVTIPPADKLKMGESFYKQGKYDIALVAFKQEMKSPDPERSAEASFKAAECYVAMNKPEKAKEILEKLVKDESPRARKAKKMLRKLQE